MTSSARRTAGRPLHARDSFDVPVIYTMSSVLTIAARRPSRKRIDAATAGWTPGALAPRSGIYRIPTTWRQVLDAAQSVGRDPRPWLTATPQFAQAELFARIAPLRAYLMRPRGARRHVTTNNVYTDAAERSERAAASYRIGMTMAEWMCRGQIGLGPTLHAEQNRPRSAGIAWSNNKTQPDLTTSRPGGLPWLIEAKGGGLVSRAALLKGAAQLNTRDLMAGPFVKVLCGTSMNHRLHMTVNVEVPEPFSGYGINLPALSVTDVETLVDLARERMPVYYAINNADEDNTFAVRVGERVRDLAETRRWWLPKGLEDDPSTTAARERPITDRSPSTVEMIATTLPATGITVGLSKRLFAVCRELERIDRARLQTSMRKWKVESPHLFGADLVHSTLSSIRPRKKKRARLI